MAGILLETGRPDAEERSLAGLRQKTSETGRMEARTDRWKKKNQSNQLGGAPVLLSDGCTKIPTLMKGKALLCLAICEGRSH